MSSTATVLIIEDSKELVILYEKILAPLGCRTVSCSTGKTAFEFLRESLPDVIVTDLTLPDMATEIFYETLLGIPKIDSVPLILISGRDDLSSWQDLFNAAYALKKPTDVIQFRNCVKSLIEKNSNRLEI